MHGISYPSGLLRQAIFSNSRSIYFITGILSLLLSYSASFRASVINPDAICYVQSAEAMKAGLSAAMHLCGQAKWPFFSALIYGVASFLHVSYVNAAYALDSIFSLISVVSFIAIIRLLNPSIRIAWFAALTLLLSHEFNSVREYIIRDHGFWAFYLLSLWCVIQYFQNRRMSYALGWGVSLMLATLFRIEGLIFWILIPFVSFFMSGRSYREKIQDFLRLNSMMLFTISAVIVIGLNQQGEPHHLGRVEEVRYQLIHGLTEIIQRFDTRAQIIGQQVLSPYANHESKTVLSLMLVAWYSFLMVTNLSLIYTFLVIYAWCKKCLATNRTNHWILWFYLVINVLITFIFLVENMFLSKRYLLALSLTAMIWIPFALNQLSENRKWLYSIVLLMGIFSLGGIFDFGYSKGYIREAGKWMERHIPLDAKLYSNDEQLMYYSRHYGNTLFIKLKEFSELNIVADEVWKNYDYIAIRSHIKKVKNQSEYSVLGMPVQVFANKRGDQVNIYKVH